MLLEEGTRERLGLLVDPEVIGVDHAAGDDQGVEIGGVGPPHGDVDGEPLPLFGAVIALQLSALRRDQGWHTAGFLDGIPRAGQLHLLHTVRQQERDFLAGKIVL
ncbi:hypothetical protein SRABI128_04744 [Microbacterium sp. Bi128]|nr:hypothetical protein SRABI128_04744 [Microbacterium sp. Bi128]